MPENLLLEVFLSQAAQDLSVQDPTTTKPACWAQRGACVQTTILPSRDLQPEAQKGPKCPSI